MIKLRKVMCILLVQIVTFNSFKFKLRYKVQFKFERVKVLVFFSIERLKMHCYDMFGVCWKVNDRKVKEREKKVMIMKEEWLEKTWVRGKGYTKGT